MPSKPPTLVSKRVYRCEPMLRHSTSKIGNAWGTQLGDSRWQLLSMMVASQQVCSVAFFAVVEFVKFPSRYGEVDTMWRVLGRGNERSFSKRGVNLVQHAVLCEKSSPDVSLIGNSGLLLPMFLL
jgi:hypothetical protein